MALFDHGDQEEFLLFQQNYQITLEASWNITVCEKNIIYVLLHMDNRYLN